MRFMFIDCFILYVYMQLQFSGYRDAPKEINTQND